jgi:hypothetical protein
MTKQNGGAKLPGIVIASVVAVAACSFPTYNITLPTGGGGDGATSAATSVSATSGGSSSSTGEFDAGACPLDEDTDGVTSWQCPGGEDCADQDSRAHPGADFVVGGPIKGTTRAGTLPYDFNCNLAEEKQTLTLNCKGLCLDPSIHGFDHDVACNMAGALGHCGNLPCDWISDSKSTTQLCK